MGVKSIHCVDYAECGGVDSRTEIPKLAHTAGELTTVEPTCVEQGKVTSVCTVCGNEFTVETTPALGHTTTNGKCERCGEYVNSPSKVPYVTAAVDGTKDAAYDSGAKYYVNGATAYVVYDKDYFYVYIEAVDAENVAYFTIGNPDKTDNVGPFWSNTAEIKFDFTAKNLWTTDSFACSIFNQNGASTFADNISVDTGATLIAKAGVDYAFADGKNAVELKIHIGEGYAPNNYVGRAYVGNSIYNIGLGTEENGINLKNYSGNLTVAVLNGALTNIVLDKCLGGCVNTERVTTVEPTCTEVGTSVEKCTVCGAEVDGTAEEIPALGHTWTYLDEEINVAPSCTETGTAFGRYCTVCTEHEFAEDLGEEYFVIPALGHDYVYTCDPTQKNAAYKKGHIGTCTRCNAVSEVLAHNTNELGICEDCGANVKMILASYNISLANSLTVNLICNASDFANYDRVLVRVVEHADTDITTDITTRTENKAGTQYQFAYAMPPYRTVDDFDVYLVGIKDGQEYVATKPQALNVVSTIYRNLNASNSSDSLKSMMLELLNYITEAQKLLNFKVDSLANANVTEAQKTAYGLDDNTDYTNIRRAVANEETTGQADCKSSAIVCGATVRIRYYFTIDSDISLDDIRVVAVNLKTGNPEAEFSDSSDFKKDSSRDWYYCDLGLGASKLSDEIVFNIYIGDTLITARSLYMSVESGVARNTTALYQPMLDAMMKYGRAAAAYANR